MKIEHIRDHVDAITRIARWHHEQWSSLNPSRTLFEREAELFSHLDRGHLPETFVALVDGEVVGCASLIEHDMDTHAELQPWLASVYVQPEFRCRGIGTALVEHVTEEARNLGFDELYLYSPDAAHFYEKQGWRHRADEFYHDHPVAIMTQRLAKSA